MSDAQFYGEFCHTQHDGIAEYWRSGGVTGQPLFYPRSFRDIEFGLESFARTFDCAGATRGERAHISFPLGIHPVGQIFSRCASSRGITVNWAGSGTSTPSALQLELIQRLKPTIWLGMSSYALHLTNLAEARGMELTSIKRIMTSAEPVSQAKRDKIERSFGAKLTDNFGMTEAGHDGRRVEGRCARLRLSHLDRLVLHRGARPEVARAGEGGRGRHAGGDRAADQQRHALPALELGRPRHLQRGGRRGRPLLGLPAHQARAPHRRLLQGARRQPRPPGPRGLHVPPPRDRRLPRRGAERGRQRHPAAFDRSAPRQRRRRRSPKLVSERR